MRYKQTINAKRRILRFGKCFVREVSTVLMRKTGFTISKSVPKRDCLRLVYAGLLSGRKIVFACPMPVCAVIRLRGKFVHDQQIPDHLFRWRAQYMPLSTPEFCCTLSPFHDGVLRCAGLISGEANTASLSPGL